ncbi:GNAT family N-acetyltransferase [Rhodoflexus sp.]
MISYLSFDSDLFGYKVGLLNNCTDLSKKIYIAQQENYKLLYLKSETIFDKTEIISNHGFLADIKVVFTKNTDSTKSLSFGVDTYDSLSLNNDLLELAYQSGEHSRFFTDKKFIKDEFKKLYYTWIERSVKKEIADHVLVCYDKEKIIGLLTLKFINDRSDIGILAVDRGYRGKRIGESLVVKALQMSKDAGCSIIQVATQKENSNACNFYHKQGFLIEKIEYIYHFWL